jgi:hypothetical protein
MSKKVIKIVTTIKGEELPISKTKKFPNGYYKIGDENVENSGDCYKINDKFYRFETGQLVFNNSIQKYQLSSNDVIYGLIDNSKFGYFNRTEPEKIPLVLENGNKSFAINEEVLKSNLEFREELSTGNFVHISKLSANKFNKILPPKNEYKTSLPYDSKGITGRHSDLYERFYDSKINNNCNTVAEIIDGLSFGLEFETIAGFIPERITKKLGLIPLRDGSISGLEYVTVPFSGNKGVQAIVDVCKVLKERTEFNNSCSFHLHIGNVPRTPEFILAFLKVSSFVQNDIYSMFPLYKQYNMGIKNKNYSKPYDMFDLFSKMDSVIDKKNINKNFNVLFSFLASNKASFSDYSNDLNLVDSHPLDPSGNQKWNVNTRYFLHNFIPLIFGNKQTVEFRVHTPTFDYYKIIMFLLMNSILVKTAIKYEKEILQDPLFFDKIKNSGESKMNLSNLLYFYRRNNVKDDNGAYIVNSLCRYISYRKQKAESLTAQGMIAFEDHSIAMDKEMEFDTNRILDSNQKLNVSEQPVALESIDANQYHYVTKKTIQVNKGYFNTHESSRDMTLSEALSRRKTTNQTF